MVNFVSMEKFGFVPANHAEPKFFPIVEDKVFDQHGKAVPGYKRVARGDTGDTMAVMSADYKVITYERQFRAFDEALRLSPLDLSEMRIATDLTHDGARVFRQYVLPAYTIETSPGRELAMRFIMFGSYDGSTAFKGRVGAYDFVCANTSVIGKDLMKISVKHIGDTESKIDNAADALVRAASGYIKQKERIQRWQHIDVDPSMVKKLLKDELPQATEPLVDKLVADYVVAGELTLLGLWNVLTHWSTHHKTKAQRMQTVADREKRVTDLVEGRGWDWVEQTQIRRVAA